MKVSCRVDNFDQRLWHLCCSDGGRISDALAGRDFFCNYYKKKLPPKPRCKYDVELENTTRVIIATAFGEIAESLFGVIAEDLYANINEGGLSFEYIDKHMTLQTMLSTYKLPNMILWKIRTANSQSRSYMMSPASNLQLKNALSSPQKN